MFQGRKVVFEFAYALYERLSKILGNIFLHVVQKNLKIFNFFVEDLESFANIFKLPIRFDEIRHVM